MRTITEKIVVFSAKKRTAQITFATKLQERNYVCPTTLGQLVIDIAKSSILQWDTSLVIRQTALSYVMRITMEKTVPSFAYLRTIPEGITLVTREMA